MNIVGIVTMGLTIVVFLLALISTRPISKTELLIWVAIAGMWAGMAGFS